jgi:transcription initiation factor TFIID subunit 11
LIPVIFLTSLQLIQVVVGSGNPKNTDKIVIALAGVTKVFVGELIEEARRIAEERQERGPLAPTHIQEAYQILNSKGLNETAEPRTKKRIRW